MFTLPKLKYEYNSLEPVISEDIMITHHKEHHQTYVNTLNKLVQDNKLQGKSLNTLLYGNNRDTLLDKQLRDYGGGHFNHSLFWVMMSPQKKDIPDDLLFLISEAFGSLEKFKEEFNFMATKLFGSGWVWLVYKDKVYIETSTNQDNPMMRDCKVIPLLCLDVWEHAYYLQYKNRRKEYIEKWWNVVDWEAVNEIYQECVVNKKNLQVTSDGLINFSK
ncbi:superoxide dismutase (SODM) [Vairimorpha necatrix]|uniref:Superoxide dismutase n=1 Tax=Vairimorpha necatrix TaxID=6039 RepID=A0AAX4JG26_9MICR